MFYSVFILTIPQTIYSELQLIGFNLMFSALPIISYGLFEQHLPATLLYEKPALYKLVSWSPARFIVRPIFHCLMLFAACLVMNPVHVLH